MEADTTRFKTYASINPKLEMHDVYDQRPRKDFIPEHYRIAFTRMRTSSHRLRVETGRWVGLARYQRMCKCRESVQDERHVLTECTLTKEIRVKFGSTVTYPDIITKTKSLQEFKYIYDVLKIIE